jgi:hypothetical protein
MASVAQVRKRAAAASQLYGLTAVFHETEEYQLSSSLVCFRWSGCCSLAAVRSSRAAVTDSAFAVVRVVLTCCRWQDDTRAVRSSAQEDRRHST